MGKRIIRIPLKYAIQDFNETPIYSGEVLWGVPESANYDEAVSQRYNAHSYQLWFDIPEDLYKYDWGENQQYGYTKKISIKIPKEDVEFASFKYVKQIGKKEYIKTVYDKWERTISVLSRSAVSTDGFMLQPGGTITDGRGNWVGYDFGDSHGFVVYIDQMNFNALQQFDSKYAYLYNGRYVYEIEHTESEYYDIYAINSTLNRIKRVENFYLEIEISDIDILVNPTYPINVYVNKNNKLITTWDYANSINRDSQYLYPTNSVVSIKDKNGKVITGTVPNGSLYKEFSSEQLSELSVGECELNITTYTNYETYGTGNSLFDLYGASDAPIITEITQNSFPEVNWTCDNQIAWQMIVKRANAEVYSSGLVTGNDKTYKIPIMLDDGTYSVELRALNNYGIYTGWTSALLILNPTKPDAPSGIIVSPNSKFGITVSCENEDGELYVVRRKTENDPVEILGRYTNNYSFYKVPLNENYEYTVRRHEIGYSDGKWIDGIVINKGVIIRDYDDSSNYVNVWMNESETNNYTVQELRSDVLIQCVGRKHPVLEIGEWLNSNRTLDGCVSDEEFKQLIDMTINSRAVYLQSDKEVKLCYMQIQDNGRLSSGMHSVGFSFAEIDEV